MHADETLLSVHRLAKARRGNGNPDTVHVVLLSSQPQDLTITDLGNGRMNIHECVRRRGVSQTADLESGEPKQCTCHEDLKPFLGAISRSPSVSCKVQVIEYWLVSRDGCATGYVRRP